LVSPELFLIAFIIVGVLGRVNIVSVAASLLLVMRMLSLSRFFPMLERRSLELGLLFLMISILVPVAAGKMDTKDIVSGILSPAGIAVIIGGIIATVINAKGLALLQAEPSLLFGILVGSVVGIVFFHGMPVGPLMAAAIAALVVQIFRFIG
jgi:uncharacterized membrane protein (DUF441 family)